MTDPKSAVSLAREILDDPWPTSARRLARLVLAEADEPSMPIFYVPCDKRHDQPSKWVPARPVEWDRGTIQRLTCEQHGDVADLILKQGRS